MLKMARLNLGCLIVLSFFIVVSFAAVIRVVKQRSSPLINNQIRSLQGLRVNSPRGEAEWAIDPWPLRAKGN